MTRTTARELAIQLSFAANASGRPASELFDEFFSEEYFSTLAEENPLFVEIPDDKQLSYIKRLITLEEENRSELEGYVERYAKGWKVGRISRTALAIMRCALCEIIYMDDIPNAAAINEAVELDKGYDEVETVAFVNGVLGGFVRGEINKAEE